MVIQIPPNRTFDLCSEQDITFFLNGGGDSDLIGWTGSQRVVGRDYADMDKVKGIGQTFSFN